MVSALLVLMDSDVQLLASFAFSDLHIRTLIASADLEEFREC